MPRPRHSPAITAITAILAALASTAALLAALTSPASAAVEPIRVEPTKLPLGADQTGPHVEGTTLVDGALEIPIDAARVDFLGRAGADYIVSAVDAQGRGPVLRITATSDSTTLVTPSRNGDLVRLSSDGSRLAQAKIKAGFTSSRVTVWSTRDGEVLARRAVAGIQTVLDLDRRRVVLGSEDGTRVWRTTGDPAADSVKTATTRTGYLADISSDRLASLDGDPFDGGCTVVSRLSSPTSVLWRSCAERVESFSPGARRMATVDLLSDGIGPSQVFVRTGLGVAKGVYRVRGFFGLLTWESPRALLLEAYGRKQGAVVRCAGSTCTRAGDLVETPSFRTAVRPRAPAPFRTTQP